MTPGLPDFLLQLNGSILGIFGALLMSSQSKHIRQAAFSLFFASNCCIGTWCFLNAAWYLMALQIVFLFTSAFGMWSNRKNS